MIVRKVEESQKTMAKNKIKEFEVEIAEALEPVKEKTEKEKLLELYDTLKSLNINSISDLENLIARA